MKVLTGEFKRPKGGSAGIPGSTMPVVIVAIFISLVAATVIATLLVRSTNEAVSQHNLADAVDTAIDSINTELTEGISQLHGIQGLFNASNSVTREEFSIFVERFLKEPHGVQALEWIARVPASQKERYINGVRQEGFEGFIIHPATEAQDFFPVTYLAPFSGNTAALGFDLNSEEIRRAALIKAWETGELAITDPITLVQETGTQLAFLAYAPIYSTKDIPPTLQERRDSLVGFGLGVIRFGDFINHSLPASFDPDIGIIVIDVDDHPKHESVYYTNLEPIERTLDDQGSQVARSVAVGDKEWIFHFTAPPGYGLSGLERAAWILVLAAGLFFSIVILSIVLLLYRSRQAALALSVERQESEQIQRALADDLTQLIETANNPIFGVDMDGLVNVWNQAMEGVTGISNTGASGHPAIQFIGLRSRDSAQEHLQAVLTGESCEHFELELPRLTGETATL
jgi:CHASE1-domain containing sensor protein